MVDVPLRPRVGHTGSCGKWRMQQIPPMQRVQQMPCEPCIFFVGYPGRLSGTASDHSRPAMPAMPLAKIRGSWTKPSPNSVGLLTEVLCFWGASWKSKFWATLQNHAISIISLKEAAWKHSFAGWTMTAGLKGNTPSRRNLKIAEDSNHAKQLFNRLLYPISQAMYLLLRSSRQPYAVKWDH